MKEIEPCYRILGAKIQQLRLTLGVSQADFAKRLGHTRTSLCNIEAGRQRILLHQVEPIAAAFGTTPRHLMKGIWW